jgi:hypothetical protein
LAASTPSICGSGLVFNNAATMSLAAGRAYMAFFESTTLHAREFLQRVLEAAQARDGGGDLVSQSMAKSHPTT